MWSPQPYLQCDLGRDPAALLPTPVELPIPRLELSDEVPHGPEIFAALGSGPPGEALLALGVLLLVVCVLAARRWVRRTGGSGEVRAGVAARLGGGIVCALLLLAGLVPLSFWLALQWADESRCAHDHQGAARLLLQVDELSDAVSWVRRWRDVPPTALMLEANAVEGIAEALARDDVEAALELAAWPEPRTAEGRSARSAALLARAAEDLARDRLESARAWAHRAFAADPGSPFAADAVSLSEAHLAIREIHASRLSAAREHVFAIVTGWRPELYGLIDAVFAREIAITEFGEGRPLSAAQTLEQAWDEASKFPAITRWMSCDLAGAWERVAAAALTAGDPERAVAALRSAESYVTGSPATEQAFPSALLALGRRQVTEGLAREAIATLEEAIQRAPPEFTHWEKIVDDLVRAWLVSGHQQFQAGFFQGAVEAMEAADRLAGHTPETRMAVAKARLGRADRYLELGAFGHARKDLELLAGGSPMATEANLRLRFLTGAAQRLEAIRRAGAWIWAALPSIVGERPHVAADGGVDFLLYFGPDGLVASRDLALERPQVAFTRAPEHAEVHILLRDLDGRGEYGERILFGEGDRSWSLLDLDGDRRADLELHYVDGVLVSETVLSGRVLFLLDSVVVAAAADPFSRIDAYLVVDHNNQWSYRSSTVLNDQFPVWGEGVVLDWKHGDSVCIRLWDQDVFWNDFLDWRCLSGAVPRSGVYRMVEGRGAIRIFVEPTDLAPGFTVVLERPAHRFNVFRDDPELARQHAKLVARAREVEENAETLNWIAELAVSELLIYALLPEAPVAVQLALGLGVDVLVVDPLLEP